MKTNSLWMVSGNGSYALFQGLIMIFISKTLGVEALGYFSLALALTAPIMLFSNFGLRTLWITDVGSEFSFKQFLRLRVFTVLVGLCFSLLIASFYINEGFGIFLIIILVGLSKAIESFSDLQYAVYHKNMRQKKIAISLVLRGGCGALGIFLGALYFNSLEVAVLFYLLSWALVFLIIDFPAQKDSYYSCQNLESHKSTEVLKLGLPLALAILFINLNLMGPRIILEQLVSIQALGIFASLYFFVQIGSIVANSIGQTAIPKLAKFYHQGLWKEHLTLVCKVLLIILLMGVLLAIFFYFFGEIILMLLFNEEISQNYKLLSLMFLVAPLFYFVSVMGHVMSSIKANKHLAINQLLVMLVNLLLCFIFIPEYGLHGVVYAAAFASGMAVIIYSFIYLLAIRKLRNV